jgi:RNase P subunit RPR2
MIVEYLYLMWVCNFCGYMNRVSLRERMHGDFPDKSQYDSYKPYSCFHCGSHEHFELRASHLVSKKVDEGFRRLSDE